MTYDEAFALLREYNSEPFHITHALTVSNVMRRMADLTRPAIQSY